MNYEEALKEIKKQIAETGYVYNDFLDICREALEKQIPIKPFLVGDGYANGKLLNITKGPFAISYTVHPNVTNPLLVWAKITVSDPWQQVIAEDGYNRGYSSEETKTITVYREGIHYLTIEGEFATIDYSIKTGDPAPEITPAPAPEYYEDEWFEGEGPY